MKSIIVLSVLLLSVIAATIGTTITTTIQIQPAYSQASHCSPGPFGLERCVTPGKDPSAAICISGIQCITSVPIPHQQAGQQIGDCHSNPGCTVRP